MKKFLNLPLFIFLIGITLFGCSKMEMNDYAPEVQKKTYQSGTDDGYFWSLWKSDGLNGSVNYSNGDGGNYSVSWDMNDGNFTCGKGWSSGSRNRVVGYNCGAFTLNGGGGSMAYYGWTRNPLIEYYVNEKWGASHRPENGASLGTVYSDGGTYNIYTAWRSNAPSIDGTQSFRQVYSTRTSQNSTGASHTITFANHANAWAAAGYGLGSDISPSAILLTEAWGNSDGYCNVTVWEAGSAVTDPIAGVKRLVNRGTGLSIDGLGRTTNGDEAGQYNSSSTNARWNIVSAGSGYYYIVNQGTNMKLDGYGRTTNGSAVAQYNNSTTHYNAQWKFVSAGSGYYYIQNRGTNMKIDGYGRTSNGSALAQYDSSTTHVNAQWQLVD